MTFGVTGLAFLPGLFRYRLLDLTPVAWAVVVEGIDDPVVVIDPWGRIVELNPAASKLIGRPGRGTSWGTRGGTRFAHWPALEAHLDGLANRD